MCFSLFLLHLCFSVVMSLYLIVSLFICFIVSVSLSVWLIMCFSVSLRVSVSIYVCCVVSLYLYCSVFVNSVFLCFSAFTFCLPYSQAHRLRASLFLCVCLSALLDFYISVSVFLCERVFLPFSFVFIASQFCIPLSGFLSFSVFVTIPLYISLCGLFLSASSSVFLQECPHSSVTRAVFATLYFLCNLWMGPISKCSINLGFICPVKKIKCCEYGPWCLL
jgi:hypothetical protein